MKDLQRLLRQDTETREAFQVLGQYNIAKSDLVPLIVTYPNDTELVYNACKDTMPAIYLISACMYTRCLPVTRLLLTWQMLCSESADLPNNAN